MGDGTRGVGTVKSGSLLLTEKRSDGTTLGLLFAGNPPAKQEEPENRLSGGVSAKGRQRIKMKYLILRYLNIRSQKTRLSLCWQK